MVKVFKNITPVKELELRLFCLRGMTWQHRRAIAPLAGTLAVFGNEYPDIEIEWTHRPLAGFEFQSVEELSYEYDLIILDHPFMGDAARKNYLLPLDEGVVGRDSDYIGASLASYRYEGSVYAVPVDAACQVAVFRPDLMARLDTAVPQTWPEVLALGETAARHGLALAIALAGVHGLMSFFSLMAGLGKPCAASPGEPFCDRGAAREALAMLRGLLRFCPPQVLDWNSIRLHEEMVAQDLFAYCPAVYCYATYAESDQRRPLRFAGLPGRKGSTIGGTGLAVSASCKAPEAALAYAGFAACLSTQRLFARHHGQPARIEVWHDAAIDRLFGGCFAATRATLESCWIRPRYPGYLAFQERGGRMVEQHLRGHLGEADLLDNLQTSFRTSTGAS